MTHTHNATFKDDVLRILCAASIIDSNLPHQLLSDWYTDLVYRLSLLAGHTIVTRFPDHAGRIELMTAPRNTFDSAYTLQTVLKRMAAAYKNTPVDLHELSYQWVHIAAGLVEPSYNTLYDVVRAENKVTIVPKYKKVAHNASAAAATSNSWFNFLAPLWLAASAELQGFTIQELFDLVVALNGNDDPLSDFIALHKKDKISYLRPVDTRNSPNRQWRNMNYWCSVPSIQEILNVENYISSLTVAVMDALINSSNNVLFDCSLALRETGYTREFVYIEKPTVEEDAREPKKPESTFNAKHSDKRYETLKRVLYDAYNRAAVTKGDERHATQDNFEDQGILQRIKKYGDGFAFGQVDKKIEEAVKFIEKGESDKAVNELLDAIVYIAAVVIKTKVTPKE